MEPNRRMPPPPPPIPNLNPQSSNGSSKKPRSSSSKWILIILGILALAVIAGILVFFFLQGSPQDDRQPALETENEEASQTNPGQTAETGTNDNEKSDFSDRNLASVGESIVGTNGVTYTLLSVSYSDSNESYKAGEGKTFVHCLVRIENTSNEEITYNIFYWSMENEDGEIENVNFEAMADIENTLGSGDLALDESVEGVVSFIETDTGDLVLEAQDAYLNTVEAAWIILR